MPQTFHTLYLCYFGLREPLVQTQVLPYLREVKEINNLKVSLLTFEPEPNQNWTQEQVEETKRNLKSEGIEWSFLQYHKTPSSLATIYDVVNGIRFVRKLNRKQKIHILHARAHVPMLIAMIAEKFIRAKTIFDLRGLVAEEYVDAGIWKEDSKPFRFTKFIERKGLEKASQIIVLTERMRDFLSEKNIRKSEDIEVIPCCFDFSRIKEQDEKKNPDERFKLIYAGSVTGLYLLREMGEFFVELQKYRNNSFFQILTASPPNFVHETFKNLGINETDYDVKKISPGEVPNYLKNADLGISFRSPTFSQIAASPTKIPEYLACGLPVITNANVGDTTEQIQTDGVGAIVENFTKDDYSKALQQIQNLAESRNLPEECFESAVSRFDIKRVGGVRYRAIYNKLLNKL